MKRPRRNHTATYKAKVALAALKGDKTLAELSEKFDVHSSQIVQWKAQLLDGAMGVFLTPAEKRESQGPSVKDMQAKIGQLALENEWKGRSYVEVGDGRCHDADSIHSDQRGPSMKNLSGVVAVLGIDLAKRVFALHGVDAAGKTVFKQVIPRSAFNRVIAQLPPCLIGLEACSGAHEWARQFQAHGHTVKLIAPAFVTPYRKSGKNDDNDAEAICEAVARPNMRFVPVKTRDQQALLSLHRVRQGFVEERTALINRLRGLLAEFGFVFAQRHGGLREIPAAAEGLPVLAKRAVDDLLDHLRQLNERIAGYDVEFQRLAKQDDAAKRIMTIPGVGPITALGMVATLGNARDFKNGRQLAAWLGLTPKQHSSGGKARLGGVTKRGDDYLRTLLVQGARAAMHHASRAEPTRLRRWAANLVARRGYHKANIALAAKNARIVWAILARGGEFEAKAAAA